MQPGDTIAILNNMQASVNDIVVASAGLSEAIGNLTCKVSYSVDTDDFSAVMMHNITTQFTVNDLARALEVFGDKMEAFMTVSKLFIVDQEDSDD